MRYFIPILLLFILSFPSLADDTREINQVGRFGRGTAHTLAWRPDGEVLAVGSATGVWFFDEDFNELGRLAEDMPVDKLEWSPDGERFIAFDDSYQTENCQLIIWNVSLDLRTSSKDKVFDYCAESVDWSSDGELIAIGVADRFTEYSNVIVLSADNYEVLNEFSELGMYVAFSPNNRYLAINNNGNNSLLTILEPNTRKVIKEIREFEVFGEVSWSFDGEYILTGCNIAEWDFGGSCQLDVVTGDIVNEIAGIPRVRWSPTQNDFLAQAINFYGGSAWIYVHFEDYQNLVENLPAFEFISEVQWHPSGNYITVLNKNWGVDSFVTNIDESSATVVQEKLLFSSTVKSITWNPENFSLLSTSESADYVWNWSGESNQVRTPSVYITENTGAITQTNTEVRWISEIEFITISLMTDYGINFAFDNRIRNAESGEVVDTPLYYYSYFDYLTEEGGLPLTSWSHSLDFVAYTSFDDRENVIIANKLFAEDEILNFDVRADNIRQIEWSPDDSMIATAGNISDSYFRIDIWDSQTGQRLNTIQRGYLPHFTKFHWSPDNSKILIVGERLAGMGARSRFLTLYDVGRDYNQWEITQMTSWYEDVYESPNQLDVAWSSASKIVAISFDIEIRFYDVESKELITTIKNNTINSLDWHENGQYLAGGASDGTIYVWDVSALMDE